ncbi:TPA: DnaD domain protein [bacterium]|jgi:DNA replication protein|nr:DnaD domain protein [bacterium]
MEEYKKILPFVDIRMLLLDRYKDLGLSEKEVMILLMVDYYLNKGINIIAPETLSVKMSMDISEIDSIFLGLVNKGLVYVKDDLTTSLEGLYKRLFDGVKFEIGKINTYTKEESDSLYSLFEKEFGRPLTNMELEVMRSWMENGYSINLIKEALQETIAKNIRNIKYVDKVILSYIREKEIKQEGFSTNSEKWRHNIEETIEIANINWLDKK